VARVDRYEQITYAVADRTATITLNRPDRLNAYTVRMADELADALDRADADELVRVAVLTGAGDHFCAGADPSTVDLDLPKAGAAEGGTAEARAAEAGTAEAGAAEARAAEGGTAEARAAEGGTAEGGTPEGGAAEASAGWQEPAGRCSMRIFRMNKPVIAAIRGAAVGAGATIILPADYRLAATDARFGYVFSRRGIFPEAASTWFLPRLVGMGRALDWMVSGRAVDAAEALGAGLVQSVHEPDQLLPKAYQLAQTLISKTAPVSVAVIRQALYRMSALDSPEPVQRLDSRLIAGCVTSADALEGFAAFQERRDPRFTGRIPADLPDYLPWLPH
jgi:enoyl-CoA hydratase/carnithine racemase